MSINPMTPPGMALDDAAQAASWDLGTRGLIDPANGSTRRIPGVRNEEELMGIFNGWFSERQQQRGGAALDGNFAPRGGSLDGNSTAGSAAYSDRRFSVVERFEGTREGVYRDNVGLRTVGVGFNMDQSGARTMWQEAGMDPARFDGVRDGRERLAPAEVRRLADFTIDRAETFLRTRVGDASMTEQQRLALVSLAFNGPGLIGPRLTAAVKAGDWNAAVNEVLYDSGTARNPALASRRYQEATMMLGVDAQRLLPSFAEYRASPGARPTQTASR